MCPWVRIYIYINMRYMLGAGSRHTRSIGDEPRLRQRGDGPRRRDAARWRSGDDYYIIITDDYTQIVTV